MLCLEDVVPFRIIDIVDQLRGRVESPPLEAVGGAFANSLSI